MYHHFRLASGVPYAISTMLHYGILLLGFFIALATLGIDLSQITLLAGALSVGIGFGLQNVINNFVSGYNASADVVRFFIADNGGRTLASGSTRITDTSNPSSMVARQRSASGALYYEKQMLEKWLKSVKTS